MEFNEILDKYMTLLSCTSKEISTSSGLSETVISRYKNGTRTPKDKESIDKIVNAIKEISKEKDISVDEKELEKDFNIISSEDDFLYFQTNFNKLITELKINVADISRFIGFDSSYLSKIRKGVRKPHNLNEFSISVGKYISSRFNTPVSKASVASLLNLNPNKLEKNENYIEKIKEYLLSKESKHSDSINELLNTIDKFDLNKYIKEIKYDQIKLFTTPIELPKSKSYMGLEGYKASQRDALKAVIMSKSKEDIYFYSNMSLLEASRDTNFANNFVLGLTYILKKGLTLNIVHNIDRPYEEIIIGITSWLPLYMTGQINPYYVKRHASELFNQINMTAGTVALSGESVNNNMQTAKFYVTNKKEEVDFYKERTKILFKKATPLMKIYKKENQDKQSYELSLTDKVNVINNLPIYALNKSELEEILKKNKVKPKEREEILSYYNIKCNEFKTIIKTNKIKDILYISKNEKVLSLPELFLDKKITIDELTFNKGLNYLKNIPSKNYELEITKKEHFKNISILMSIDKEVTIVKENDPSIIFVINHRTLTKAIENYSINL